jgi:hypothetical protein
LTNMTSNRPDAQQRMTTGDMINSYTCGMTEAGSPTKSSVPASDIASAIAARWNEEDSSNVEMLAPTFVYLRQHRLLESVFDDAASAFKALDVLTKVQKSGVNVAVILPVVELGRAHEELWGTGLVLHGWIEHDDGTVRFTGPEVA